MSPEQPKIESLEPKQILEKTEKRWQEIKKDVEKIIDGAGKPIDAGIKETVVALRVLKINTSASCEGPYSS